MKDDAAAAHRSLCSRRVVDKVLDDREGVLNVLESLDVAWASSAARGLRPELIGCCCLLHRSERSCRCIGLDDEELDQCCGRWNVSRTS